jgi:hypothetical protein
MQTMLYNALGKTQGLLVESELRLLDLKSKFVDNGVVRESIDQSPGIGDFIMGHGIYSANGLYPRLQLHILAYAGDYLQLCTSLENICMYG